MVYANLIEEIQFALKQCNADESIAFSSHMSCFHLVCSVFIHTDIWSTSTEHCNEFLYVLHGACVRDKQVFVVDRRFYDESER